MPRPLTMKKDTIQTRKRKPKCSPNQQQPKQMHELRDSATVTVGEFILSWCTKFFSRYRTLIMRILNRTSIIASMRMNVNANKLPFLFQQMSTRWWVPVRKCHWCHPVSVRWHSRPRPKRYRYPKPCHTYKILHLKQSEWVFYKPWPQWCHRLQHRSVG